MDRCSATKTVSHNFVCQCGFLAGTVCIGKGAQGTWCVTHSKWCTRVAVTCDKVDKVYKGGAKCLKNYYI